MHSAELYTKAIWPQCLQPHARKDRGVVGHGRELGVDWTLHWRRIELVVVIDDQRHMAPHSAPIFASKDGRRPRRQGFADYGHNSGVRIQDRHVTAFAHTADLKCGMVA